MNIDQYNKLVEVEPVDVTLEEYEILVNILNKWSNEYYIDNNPSVPDYVYDKGYKQVKLVEEINPSFLSELSPTQRISNESDGKIAHKNPMLSISNVNDDRSNLIKLLDEYDDFCVELKYDGIAATALYTNGKLEYVATRGDGVYGKDITRHFKGKGNIPLAINTDQSSVEVRGEIIISFENFIKLNEFANKSNLKVYKNTRNAAGGLLTRKEYNEILSDMLTFMPYSVIGLNLETHYEMLNEIENYGFNVSDKVKRLTDKKEVLEYLKNLESDREKFPYEVDGAVIKLNKITDQEDCGYTAKAPKFLLAQKFKPLEKQSKILDIKFQVGRTGRVTPVAKISPVEINGSTITSVTLHNMDEIERLGLYVGANVSVIKGGDVIPKITQKITFEGEKEELPLIAPKNCPICNSLIKKDGAISFCTGSSICKAQVKAQIKDFIAKPSMNIDGLGVRIIEEMLDKGVIKTAPDIYKLQREDFLTLDRQGEKSINNALQSIEKSRNVELNKFINSLGIHGVGTENSKLLAKEFRNMKSLMSASYNDLMKVDGIGEVVAENINTYFNQPKTRIIVDKLINDCGLRINNPKAVIASEMKLKGKRIVITGSFVNSDGSKLSRDLIKEKLESMGAKISGSVSKNTDLVLAGDSAGSKMTKAKELGVNVVSSNKYSEDVILGVFESNLKPNSLKI